MFRFYKNWPVHNLIGHPLYEIVGWLNTDLAQKIHDATCPDIHPRT